MNQTLHTCMHRWAALGLAGLLLAIAAQAQPAGEASAPAGLTEKTRLQFSPRGLDGVCSQAPLPDLEIDGFWPREARFEYRADLLNGRLGRKGEIKIKSGAKAVSRPNMRRVINHIQSHVRELWRCEGESLETEIRITRAAL